MTPLKQSSTLYPLMFLMVDSTDHVTAKTGLAPTVTISKNGAAFGSPSGAVTEVGNGWYKVAGNATDTDTVGVLKLHSSATGADPCDTEFFVGVQDPASDVYGRIGAPAGASISADVAGVPAAVWAAGTRTLTSFGTLVADVWAYATRILTAGTNIVLAKGTGVTGFNDLDAAGVRSAVGLASANLDTQIAAVQADTDDIQSRLPGALVGGKMDSHVNDIANDAITAASIATDAIGSAELAASAVSEIQSGLSTLTTSDVQTAMTSQGYTTARAGYLDTLNGLVQAIWDKATSALTTAGSIGKRIVDYLTGDIYARLGAPAGASVSADIAAVKAAVDAISIATSAGDLTTKTADSATLTTGTNTSGSYTDTATDDNTYWVTAPTTLSGGYGLRQQLVFNLPLHRAPVAIFIRGWYQAASGHSCDLWGYNARTGVWVKLTNSTNNLAHRTTETVYSFTIPRDFGDDSGGTYNIVKFEFRSTDVTTTYRLRLDQMLLAHLSEDAPVTLVAPTPADIWSFVSRTLTDYGVEPATPPTVAEIVDGVFDEPMAGHATQDTLGIRVTAIAFGAVTGSPTTTSFVDSTRTEADNDHWYGAQLTWTSGSLKGQRRNITGFTASTHTIVTDPFTSAPVNGDTYIIS